MVPTQLAYRLLFALRLSGLKDPRIWDLDCNQGLGVIPVLSGAEMTGFIMRVSAFDHTRSSPSRRFCRDHGFNGLGLPYYSNN